MKPRRAKSLRDLDTLMAASPEKEKCHPRFPCAVPNRVIKRYEDPRLREQISNPEIVIRSKPSS